MAFKPQKSSLKAPSMGGGNQGLGTLMAYMISQQKGQGLQQQLGPDAVATGGRNPATGATFQTQAGQTMDVQTTLRKKASEDALKLQQAIPILEDLDKSYNKAYASYHGATKGLSGAMGAGQEFFNGVILRNNPDLRNFIDKAGQYEAPLVKLTGDVGNFSASERASASQAVPKVGPNSDWKRAFMPDDIDYGKTKIQSLKELYAKKYLEAKKVAETGQLSEGYHDWLKSNEAYTGGGQAQPNNPSSKTSDGTIRVRNKLSRKTGSISLDKFNPDKYEKV